MRRMRIYILFSSVKKSLLRLHITHSICSFSFAMLSTYSFTNGNGQWRTIHYTIQHSVISVVYTLYDHPNTHSPLHLSWYRSWFATHFIRLHSQHWCQPIAFDHLSSLPHTHSDKLHWIYTGHAHSQHTTHIDRVHDA